MVRTVCEDIGLAVIAAGVALVNVPAGVIAGGLMIVLAANMHDGIRRVLPSAPVKCRCGHTEAEHQTDGHRSCTLCYCGGFNPAAIEPEPQPELIEAGG